MNSVCIEKKKKSIIGQRAGQGGEELGLWTENLGLVSGFTAYHPCYLGQITKFTSPFLCQCYGIIVMIK